MNTRGCSRLIAQVLPLILCAALPPARLAALSGPVAGLTATPTSGLAPLDVAFCNASCGDHTSSRWDIANALRASPRIRPLRERTTKVVTT